MPARARPSLDNRPSSMVFSAPSLGRSRAMSPAFEANPDGLPVAAASSFTLLWNPAPSPPAPPSAAAIMAD